jgi:hypothetical protein
MGFFFSYVLRGEQIICSDQFLPFSFDSNYDRDHNTQGIHCPIVVVSPDTDYDLLGGVRRREGGREGGGRREEGKEEEGGGGRRRREEKSGRRKGEEVEGGDHDTQGIHCPVVVVAPREEEGRREREGTEGGRGRREEEGGGRREEGEGSKLPRPHKTRDQSRCWLGDHLKLISLHVPTNSATGSGITVVR